MSTGPFAAEVYAKDDQREFRRYRLGSRDRHWQVGPDRRAHSGEVSPSWEGHHMYSTVSLLVSTRLPRLNSKPEIRFVLHGE